MRYPVFIDGSNRAGYSFTVPDLPGANGTINFLAAARPTAKRIIELTLKDYEEHSMYLPTRKSLYQHMTNHNVTENTWITWIEVEND
jgi:predicted RNase H-like HicB family nuclease